MNKSIASEIVASKIINSVYFYPVFQGPDGVIGVGIGYETKQEAVEELIERDKKLHKPDTRQWVKIVHVRFEEMY